MSESTFQALINTLPQQGRAPWIGLRPGRREPVQVVHGVEASTTQGLIGDRYSGRSGQRHITLIQAEHLAVIASCLGAAAGSTIRRTQKLRQVGLVVVGREVRVHAG